MTARPIRDTIRGIINGEATKLDLGTTSGHLTFVNSGSEGNVLDSLDAMGKMLSDDVLLALIYRNPPVDAERLAHILVTTAPHSSLLLMALAEREEPISVDSLEKIYQYQDSTSSRKSIIDSIGYFRNELELVYNAFLFIADEDDYTTYPLDSVIALLEEETDVNLRVKLADLYMANGQYNEAEAIWDNIPVYYNEIAQHIYLRRVQLGLLEDGLEIEDLNGDEPSNLGNLAANNTRASWQAKAMLIALGLDTFPIEIEDRLYASPKMTSEYLAIPEDRSSVGDTWFKFYPNPANNSIILEYSIDQEIAKGCTFELFDLFGKRLSFGLLQGNQGSIAIDVSNLSNGIYLGNLNNNGTKLWQEKIVIVR